MISMCRRPKKPHRKPKPSAMEFSCVKLMDASFSFSFSSASRRSPYFEPSAGYTPEKTIGCA